MGLMSLLTSSLSSHSARPCRGPPLHTLPGGRKVLRIVPQSAPSSVTLGSLSELPALLPSVGDRCPFFKAVIGVPCHLVPTGGERDHSWWAK